MHSSLTKLFALVTLCLLVTLSLLQGCDGKRQKHSDTLPALKLNKQPKQQQQPIVISPATHIANGIARISTDLDTLHDGIAGFTGSWYQGLKISGQFERLNKRVRSATDALEKVEVERYASAGRGEDGKGKVLSEDESVVVNKAVDGLVSKVEKTLGVLGEVKDVFGSGVYASQARKALTGLQTDAKAYLVALTAATGETGESLQAGKRVEDAFRQAKALFG